MSERLVYTCDQCGRESVLLGLHVERNMTVFGDYPEADFCTYACLIQWAIAAQDRKVAAK
jgi:hypothetical protein